MNTLEVVKISAEAQQNLFFSVAFFQLIIMDQISFVVFINLNAALLYQENTGTVVSFLIYNLYKQVNLRKEKKPLS